MVIFNESMILSYQGPFLQENIETMGKMIREKLQPLILDFSVQQAIFSVFIELSHNILRYSAQNKEGFLEIRLVEEDIIVVSKNMVTEKQKKELIRRLEKLNQLNKIQLRQAYIEQRRKGEEPERLSAGLGLIEIAKRALGPLEYSFEQEGSMEMFQMNVRIGGKLRCIV